MREVDRSGKPSASSFPGRNTVEIEGVLVPGKANIRPLRVIIVEDDEVDRARCVQLLRSRTDSNSLEIVEYSTLSEAVSSIEVEAPDCVFLDFSLPDASSTEPRMAPPERAWSAEFPTVMVAGRDQSGISGPPTNTGASYGNQTSDMSDMSRTLELTLLKVELLQFKRRIEYERYTTRLRRLSNELLERFNPALGNLESSLDSVWQDLLAAAMASQGSQASTPIEQSFKHLAEVRSASEQLRRELNAICHPAPRSEPPLSRPPPRS